MDSEGSFETDKNDEGSDDGENVDENGGFAAENEENDLFSAENSAGDEENLGEEKDGSRESEGENSAFGQYGEYLAENANEFGEGAAGASEGEDEAFGEESERKRQKSGGDEGQTAAAESDDCPLGRPDEADGPKKAAALFGAKRKREDSESFDLFSVN